MKIVDAAVQSKHSMTHSFNIQQVISTDDRLLSPMYLVLQEHKSEMLARIRHTLLLSNNFHIQVRKCDELQIRIFSNTTV